MLFISSDLIVPISKFWIRPVCFVPSLHALLGYFLCDPIGIIEASYRKKVMDASKAIDPQHCQMYVMALVAKLESKGLVQSGATKLLKRFAM